MLSKIWGYLVALIAGILSLLYVKGQIEHTEDTSPQDSIIEPIKEDVEEIDNKLQEIKDNGVEDKDKQAEIDYWKEN